MWKLIGFTLIFQFNYVVQGKLVGDHVCLSEESYLANVTEYLTRNATVRNYQWCMNLPPRCSFYTTRTINESKIVERNVTRTTEKCCEGFIEQDEKCVSECDGCKNGLCENRKCLCSAGYTGRFCEVVCANGLWGSNCSLRCNCDDQKCNPVNGSCFMKEKNIGNDEIFTKTTLQIDKKDATTKYLIPENNAVQNNISDNKIGVTTEYITQRNISTTATSSLPNRMLSTVAHPKVVTTELQQNNTTETTSSKSNTEASTRNTVTSMSNNINIISNLSTISFSSSQSTSTTSSTVAYDKKSNIIDVPSTNTLANNHLEFTLNNFINSNRTGLINSNSLPNLQSPTKPSVATTTLTSLNIPEDKSSRPKLLTTTLLLMFPNSEHSTTTKLYSTSQTPTIVTSTNTQEDKSSDKPTEYNFFGTTSTFFIPNNESVSEPVITKKLYTSSGISNTVTSKNLPKDKSTDIWTESYFLKTTSYPFLTKQNDEIQLKTTEMSTSSTGNDLSSSAGQSNDKFLENINIGSINLRAHTSKNEFKEFFVPVEVHYDQINRPKVKKDALTTTPNNFADEKTFLTVEDQEYINKHKSEENSGMVVNYSIAGSTILVIIVVIVLFMGINNLRRRKKMGKADRSNTNTPAVSVYTTSIFHTPLPDPPTFDNPTYLTPTELRIIPTEQISFKSNVITPKKIDKFREKDYREYVYDHPPSTGSYRAASSIEPLESNLIQRLSELEPVYDEIPQRSLDIAETSLSYHLDDRYPTSIYINTCARTKF